MASGRRVTVVGLGREGLAVTRVLARCGDRVTVTDRRDHAALAAQVAALGDLDVTLSLGGHRPDEVLDCDLLVLSPGVDKRSPLVAAARQHGIAISSETALFLERCPARVIGITGSAGKTTTTSLAGAMLTRAFGPRRVFVGGNIGRPLLEQLDEMTADSFVVLELSSFQLEWLHISPPIAVVTNVTPNHLDRHETMAAYLAAKANILAHQDAHGSAVLNLDDSNTPALARLAAGRVLYFSLTGPSHLPRGADGACLDGQQLALIQAGSAGCRRVQLCRAGELTIPGRHNVANALAAACAASLCGVDPAIIAQSMREFTGVPHRLQPIATIKNVTYIDDSIATAPERTLAALDALAQPVVLILGGRDKCLPWTQLAHEAARRCRGVVLIGEAAPLVRGELECALDGDALRANSLLRREQIADEPTMERAVARAAALAQPGDAVVLSPGGTSYDMYRDFEERGADFAREVRRLEKHV